MAKKTESEDITLDFSFITKLFSKNKKNKGKKTKRSKKQKTESQESEEAEDLSIDIPSLISQISKYSVILLILIPIIISINIRTYPLELPKAEEWARQGIYNSLQNQITQQINEQYPNLPQQNKQALINEQLNLAISQQQAQIEQAVLQQAEVLKQRFRDEYGETYLGDIDSYFWARYAQNIAETGQIGDEYRDGVPYDDHMSAPKGFRITPNLYPYVEAYLFKFLRVFNPDISILKAAFLTPLFLSFFAIVAAFFIGKKLSGNLAGFVAAVLIAVNPTVLSRSLGSDNDIVNAVFPLIIMLFTIYAFDSKDMKKTIIFGLLTAFFTGFYAFAWSGWWFMFLFIIGAGLIYIGYIGFYELINKGNTFTNLLNNKKLRIIIVLLLVYFTGTFLSLSLFGKQQGFLGAFLNPFDIISIKEASKGANLWPNVYTTVAELNSANMQQIVGSLGGKMVLWVALIGTILALVRVDLEDKKIRTLNIFYLFGSAAYYLIFIQLALANNLNIVILLGLLFLPLFVGLFLSSKFSYEIEPIDAILMVIWFMATIYASTKGIRFILLIVPVFVISFSVFIGQLKDMIAEFISNTLDVSVTIPNIIFLIVVVLMLIQPIRNGRATAYHYVPSVNDAWVDSLTKIKIESEPDAIINSWWDFGHWFKYWADRSVTFDGASQNDQQAHWIGKVLLTDDEDQASAILRMLDCSGVDAEIEIKELTGDSFESINLLYDFFEMTESEVREKLLKMTTPEKTDEIISYMFCEPPENYFITSGDMVGKSGVWAHFGSWDFKRAKIYNYYTTKTYDEFIDALVTELNYDQEKAQRTYYELNALITDRQVNDWIAPWPSYGGGVNCAEKDENTLLCNIAIQSNQVVPVEINIETMEASININNQIYYPNTLGYFEGNEFIIKSYDENLLGYGIVLSGKTLYFMSEQLTGSMFTRLYYLDGKGLENFEKFHDVIGVDGSRIITWKVNWKK